MVRISKYLIIFGGENSKIKNLANKKKEMLRDIKFIDTGKFIIFWKISIETYTLQSKMIINNVEPRSYHSACEFEGYMFIHGGMNMYSKYLNDCYFFEFGI